MHLCSLLPTYVPGSTLSSILGYDSRDWRPFVYSLVLLKIASLQKPLCPSYEKTQPFHFQGYTNHLPSSAASGHWRLFRRKKESYSFSETQFEVPILLLALVSTSSNWKQ